MMLLYFCFINYLSFLQNTGYKKSRWTGGDHSKDRSAKDKSGDKFHGGKSSRDKSKDKPSADKSKGEKKH